MLRIIIIFLVFFTKSVIGCNNYNNCPRSNARLIDFLKSEPQTGARYRSEDGTAWIIVENIPYTIISNKNFGGVQFFRIVKSISQQKSSDKIKICYYEIAYEKLKDDWHVQWWPFVLQQENPIMGPIYVGHGIRKRASLSHDEISVLRRKYADNNILSKAFRIIESADLAVVQDIVKILKEIKSNSTPINKDELYVLMAKDMNIITDAARCFEPGDEKETRYRPFLDLLHTLGNQGKVLGYVGQKGIFHAMNIIKKYGDILEKGELPEEYMMATSKDAIRLRIALFYINLLKNKKTNKNRINFPEYKTFCSVDYLERKKDLQNALKHTSFYEQDRFFAPSNGYIKNADLCVVFKIDDLDEVDLRWDVIEENEDPRKLIYADCSGFAQAVARQYHPSNEYLSNQRQMSYQLAPLYDALANKKMKTKGVFYDINGKPKELSQEEINGIKKFSKTIAHLESVYEPVIDPLRNIKPGDLLIERGTGEGHIMFVVEQSPKDKYKIKIIELTSFNGTGYNWSDIRLNQYNQDNLKEQNKFRVLRIKINGPQ
jgi:hypothetical protein